VKRIIFLIILIFIQNNLTATEIEKNYASNDSIIVTAEKERTIPQYSLIATKLLIPLQNIPLSVGIVTNSLITTQNDFLLSDALKNISSVNTQTGFGVHDYFIIRGLSSLDNALIMTDGTLEPEVTYYNLYNIDRIEVLKGPGAFLYGSNPLSGTVNLARKQPLFKNFLNLSSTGGQYNTFRQTIDAGYSDPHHRFASRLNMLWERSDNYRDDKDNKVIAINPSVIYYLNPTLTVNANFEFIDSKYKPDTGLPLLYNPFTQQLDKIADVPRTTSYQAPFDFSDQKIFRSKLNFEKKFNNSLSFQSKFYYTRLDWNSQGTLINGAFPTQIGSMIVSRSLSYLEDLRDLYGNQNEFVLSTNTGSLQHKILAGIEWNILKEDYRYDNVPSLPPMDLFNPVETAVEGQLVMYPYLKGDVTNTVLAPYAIDHITVSDQLQLTAGLRYDIIKFENKATNFQADRDYRNLSPMIGINYSPFFGISVYANSGSAYAPPSSQVVGDQKAEKSIQYEIGIKQSYLDNQIQFDLSYYHLQKKNIAIPGFDGISKQLGDLLSKGIEVELQAEPLRNWFTNASYAYSDVELTKFHESVPVGADEYQRPIYMVFDRSGNDPAFTPKHILNIWTTKELSNGLGFGGGVRYLSDQYIDEDNVFKINAATVFDALIYYKFSRFNVSLNMKNLTSEKYEIRGFGNSSVVPAAPRSIFGKIDFSL
jgi:TonB-dependent siderophore receptor